MGHFAADFSPQHAPDRDGLGCNGRKYTRRRWLQYLFGGTAAWVLPQTAWALMPARDGMGLGMKPRASDLQLSAPQIQAVRQWIQLMVTQQLNHGPTPRWQQHDCVGLVRFASAEALRSHDGRWQQANGLTRRPLPPEPNLTADQLHALRHLWWRADGQQGAYVSALELVQYNCIQIGRDLSNAAVADLLVFDQGDEQHLMIWMGQYVAYHTGTVTPTDNGLRAYPLAQLMNWKDTRWQPQAQNPNFLGLFRLGFLATA
jgi:uncharacterized protein YfaT (DUF1175 family)